MRPLKAGVYTYLCTEHFKQWLQEACLRENSKTPPQTERWMCLLDIVQHMWHTGDITRWLGWTILVLIPKGTKDTRCIGLL